MTQDYKAQIDRAKQTLGDRLVILAHHYQTDEIVQCADFVGDSLKLARIASEQKDAEFIVFCGVHFMAESADVLTSDDQRVFLPNPEAGCPMADMAAAKNVQPALERLIDMADGAKIVPITYVNSTAAIKAVTGKFGGSCCTSGNAGSVLRWALDSGADKIFAAPDQHLIRATALDIGYSEGQCVLYDPFQVDGGLTAADLKNAKFILWDGYCHVHQVFTTEDVARCRREYEDIQVIVHPECELSVVLAADMHGSTERIIQTVNNSPAGSKWAIGTEAALVQRLANLNPDKTIVNLTDRKPVCYNMRKVTQAVLAENLQQIIDGDYSRQIKIDAEVAKEARIALERMINL